MKKILLTSAALFVCCSALSNPLSQLKPDNAYIEMGGITIDNDLDIGHVRKAKWAPDFKVGAELNGFFTDETLTILPDNKVGALADIGFCYKSGIFSPYLAAYYDKAPVTKYSKRHEDVGYEAGISVKLNDGLKPWVQADDALSLKKARARVGAEINLNNKMALDADYGFKSKEKGEEFGVGLRYII